MSYCRWSTDDFRCDLYCYESNDGFVTLVAAKRRVWEPPQCGRLIDLMDCKTPETQARWTEDRNAYIAALDAAPLVQIGLPHDGQMFVDEDLEGFKARLLMLRDAGYRFPDGVLATVEEEMQEEAEE